MFNFVYIYFYFSRCKKSHIIFKRINFMTFLFPKGISGHGMGRRGGASRHVVDSD